MADYNILPDVTSDEGEGDDLPMLRAKFLSHDILIFGGPVWLGQASSIGKRVLERIDASLSKIDEQGRMPSFGSVAVAAIAGNEDGAHASSAQLFQALNDIGRTIPALAACYWVGEAMGSEDFKEFDKTLGKVGETAALVTGNAPHLAQSLKRAPYLGSGG